MKRKALLSAILALSLLAAACSDSVADSAEDVCTSLEGLQDTVDQIGGADVSADSLTVDNVQNAVSEVESAVDDVQSAESDLSDSLKSQLQDDFDTLKSSIQGISGDSTLAEAGEDAVSAVAAFKTSWDQTLSELNCSTDS